MRSPVPMWGNDAEAGRGPSPHVLPADADSKPIVFTATAVPAFCLRTIWSRRAGYANHDSTPREMSPGFGVTLTVLPSASATEFLFDAARNCHRIKVPISHNVFRFLCLETRGICVGLDGLAKWCYGRSHLEPTGLLFFARASTDDSFAIPRKA